MLLVHNFQLPTNRVVVTDINNQHFILKCVLLNLKGLRCTFLAHFVLVFQLNMAKTSESVMDEFVEGPLNFPPTYKFDVGTHTYDTRCVYFHES